MLVDAIILAGNANLGKLQGFCEVDNKALIPIGNLLMIDYVVNALQASKQIKRIVIVGPSESLKKKYEKQENILLADSGTTIIASLQNGLSLLKDANHVLLTTSDIPLLNTEAIEAFLNLCSNEQIDFYYPIVAKGINEKQYPDVQRTYVTLKDGIFTGGNIFFFKPSIVAKCARQAEELFKLRKKPLALAKQIGIIFVLKLLLRQLSLKEVEKRFSKLLDISGKAVILEYPEIGIDVDKPSDLDLVRRVLA